MAMTTGKVEMNVTPLIDVLLVLLIIFLVIQPPRSHGLKAEAPPADKNAAAASQRDDIVVTVLHDHTVRLNQEAVDLGDLEGQLRELFKNAVHHVIFVRGGKDLDFEEVARDRYRARGGA